MKGRHSIEMSGGGAFPNDLLRGISMRSSVAGFAACRRQQQHIFHPFAGWVERKPAMRPRGVEQGLGRVTGHARRLTPYRNGTSTSGPSR